MSRCPRAANPFWCFKTSPEVIRLAVLMYVRFPLIPFERYADDAICHCRTEEQATALRDALDARFADCGLTLHPDKTKIVYCRDESRRGPHPVFRFDFLGYTFRPRLVSKRTGGMGGLVQSGCQSEGTEVDPRSRLQLVVASTQ